MINRYIAAGVAAAAMAFSSPVIAQETTLKAVTSLPKTHYFMKSFAKFVDRVNKEGKGLVQINWIGGPEVTPAPKQPAALRRGVFDVVYGPVGYYGGQIPESNAMLGTDITPSVARKNGAFNMLDAAWNKRLGARILAWPHASAQYILMLKDEPKPDGKGGYSVGGAKIRGQAHYAAMIRNIGGVLISIPPSEIQTSLERGLAVGLGWVTVSYAEQGWSKYVKYMIDPPIGHVSLAVIVNSRKFDSLPSKAKILLLRLGQAYEQETYDATLAEGKREREAAMKNGVKIIELKGEARKKYVKDGTDYFWNLLGKKDPVVAKAMAAKFRKP